MNLSTVKWAQWDKTQSRELLVCSYACASHCAQLLHTILHRTDLIVFPLTLQTITTTPMMSIWGKGAQVSQMHTAVPSIQMTVYSPAMVMIPVQQSLRNLKQQKYQLTSFVLWQQWQRAVCLASWYQPSRMETVPSTAANTVQTKLDCCIVWNAHNTVFGSKSSVISATV